MMFIWITIKKFLLEKNASTKFFYTKNEDLEKYALAFLIKTFRIHIDIIYRFIYTNASK